MVPGDVGLKVQKYHTGCLCDGVGSAKICAFVPSAKL
jgi:hypothetical protein